MNPEIYAALDANINRCIEGIRVCEDVFRFSLNNPLSSEFKDLRHRINALVSVIPAEHLLGNRDVTGDGQKFFNTPSEMRRDGIRDIFRSNIRRAIEASRVIEEFSKCIHPAVAEGFQEIRFALYDLEKNGWLILEKFMLMERFRCSLYAIIDSAFVPVEKMTETAKILTGSGAEIIQLRMKSASGRDYLTMSEKIARVCRDNNVLFIVNDRVDVAMISGAHGVHLGQDDIPVSEARSLSDGTLITGISVFTEGEAAADEEADYIAVGPVYPTSSKDGVLLKGTGIEVVKNICSRAVKPVVAIGGISESNAAELMDAGVSSLSVISALYNGGNVAENTVKLSGIIKSYRNS